MNSFLSPKKYIKKREQQQPKRTNERTKKKVHTHTPKVIRAGQKSTSNRQRNKGKAKYMYSYCGAMSSLQCVLCDMRITYLRQHLFINIKIPKRETSTLLKCTPVRQSDKVFSGASLLLRSYNTAGALFCSRSTIHSFDTIRYDTGIA